MIVAEAGLADIAALMVISSRLIKKTQYIPRIEYRYARTSKLIIHLCSWEEGEVALLAIHDQGQRVSNIYNIALALLPCAYCTIVD